LKRRFLALAVVVLVVALMLPTVAMATNSWTKSPVSPLIVGGVHTKTYFRHLFLEHTKVKLAVKAVIKADELPSWVYKAAVSEVKARDIHVGYLKHGTNIGAMAFGPVITKILNHTQWNGSRSLPYYYVDASNAVLISGVMVTTTYRVALAKTCANPFVFKRTVTRIPVVHNLYIEKRYGSVTGELLAEWHVTGTVGGVAVDKWTTSSGPVLVGSYLAGTAIDLQEAFPEQGAWFAISPNNGHYVGTMPAQDLTVIFVNAQDIPD
jgi:hypothetical protein